MFLSIDMKMFAQAVVYEPKIYYDSRGGFQEIYKESTFKEFNLKQINESISAKGVLRGLHFQKGEYAQGKIVRCLKGAIFDVAVDLRRDSPTFAHYTSVILTEDDNKLFYIPRGFAHGFLALEDATKIQYFCDNEYNKESEGGVMYNDPLFKIEWPIIPDCHYTISDKDKKYEYLNKFNIDEILKN